MKTWFITGASSGIGRSVAEKLLARGDRVAATARRPEALDDLRAAHGEQLRVVALDLTDTGAMRREVDAVFADFGPVDVVLSNAGYGLFGAAEEVTDAQIEQQIATNLIGSIQLIRACLPHLRRQGGGRVLQTSSEGGQATYPGFSIYHASKWGIEGFIEAVAQEVAAFGIDMIIVEPGPTRTRFGANVERADAMEAYASTPAGEVRNAIESGSFPLTGDAARCADAMIEAADADHPPRRLVLGSVAYNNIERTLADRLDAVRSQKAVAFGADYVGG
jgi:NAD(P)-dependent dehydrogenase (short-subunit alcohol dehydrogenase family)